MRKRSSGGCGSSLFVLFVVFVALKLAGVIDWSWWWVTSPVWLPGVLVLAGLALMAVMGVSVYKIVATVLRRQGAHRGQSREAGVLDVDGFEVPVPPVSRPQAPGFQAAISRPGDAGGPTASTAGGRTDTSASESDNHSS